MALTLGGADGYPVGVDSSHPHFHADVDRCPRCEEPAGDEVWCQSCGAVLDPDEACQDGDYAYDLARDMERE